MTLFLVCRIEGDPDVDDWHVLGAVPIGPPPQERGQAAFEQIDAQYRAAAETLAEEVRAELDRLNLGGLPGDLGFDQN